MSKNVEQLIVLSKFVELCRTATQTIDAMAKGEEYTKAEQPWITRPKTARTTAREEAATKLVRRAPFGRRYERPLRNGKIGNDRQWIAQEAESLSPCKA